MATTIRQQWIIWTILTFSIFSSGMGDQLSCYTCMGTVDGHDPNNCVTPNTNTTAHPCKPEDTHCKKRVVRAAGQVTVERRCYDDMCTDQQGIVMGQRVSIDTYCCRGALCNRASSSDIGFTFTMAVMMFSKTVYWIVTSWL